MPEWHLTKTDKYLEDVVLLSDQLDREGKREPTTKELHDLVETLGLAFQEQYWVWERLYHEVHQEEPSARMKRIVDPAHELWFDWRTGPGKCRVDSVFSGLTSYLLSLLGANKQLKTKEEKA